MNAIVQVDEDWSHAQDSKSKLTVILFDMEKAFDLVGHQLLLTKLRCYLPHWLISWLALYLIDRHQRVKFPAHHRLGSSYCRSNRTVTKLRQGSVIGPIFFILT